MAIYRLLDAANVPPLQQKAMKIAFEGVLIDLRIKDRQGPLSTAIAHSIIERALAGDLDPARLRRMVAEQFASDAPLPSAGLARGEAPPPRQLGGAVS